MKGDGEKSPFPIFFRVIERNGRGWIDGTDRFLISTPFIISGKHETEHSFSPMRDTRQLLKAPDERLFLFILALNFVD